MRFFVSALLVTVVGSLVGCGGEDPGTGDEQDITSSVCPLVDARTGKAITKTALGKLNDPIAKAVLSTGTCPKSFEQIMDKLRETDAKGCKGDRGGIKTRLVSERSQVLGEPDAFRAVVTRTCDGREDHELLLSVFGIGFDGGKPPSDLPEDVEMIGFDRDRQVFDFYTLEGGRWTHFGDSTDLIKDGANKKLRCANCHTGGGLVMKELPQPWVHWEGKTNTPGTDDLVAAFPSFGTKATGYNLEPTIRKGNTAWNASRIQIALANMKTADVLKPLFCSVEMNIKSNSTTVTSIGNDFFLDPALGRTDKLTVSGTDYTAVLKANHQRIVDDGGQQLLDSKGQPVVDTFFKFAYPERSGADIDYVQQLVAAGIVSSEFVTDVLMVDFTRPIFSDARCNLLSNAPSLKAADTKAAAVEAGFLSKLQTAKPAAGTPAAVLLANLSAKGDGADQKKKVDAFFTACKARPKKDLLTNIVRVASGRRNKVRERPIMEFSESLPIDNLNADPKSALDPVTCTLTTK